MTRKLIALIVLLTSSVSANAIIVDSSTSAYVTFRDCVNLGTTVCDSITGTLFSDVGGTPGGASAFATQTDPNYGTVTGTAQLDAGPGAATLAGSATSEAGKRNSSNTYSLQRYTNTGPDPIALIFNGIFTYDQTVPAENASFDPTSPATTSFASATMSIFSLPEPAFEAGNTPFENFVELINLPSSGTALAESTVESLRNFDDSGSQSLTVSVGLNSNESIWLYSSLQTPATNGAVVQASLVATTSIPSPGSLALLALGLAVLVRGRRTVK